MECQVNIKSQSELDIGGRETCLDISGIQAPGYKLSSSSSITGHIKENYKEGETSFSTNLMFKLIKAKY